MWILPALVLLAATSAFAAGKGTFSVDRPLTVSDHQLAPGDYQARWEGTGSDVQVSIYSDGKLVTTASATLVPIDRGNANDAVVMKHQDDGSWSLTELDFAGKKYELHFVGDAATGASGGQAGSK